MRSHEELPISWFNGLVSRLTKKISPETNSSSLGPDQIEPDKLPVVNRQVNLGNPDLVTYFRRKIQLGEVISRDPLLARTNEEEITQALDSTNPSSTLAKLVPPLTREERRQVRQWNRTHLTIKPDQRVQTEVVSKNPLPERPKSNPTTEPVTPVPQVVFEKVSSSLVLNLEDPNLSYILEKLVKDTGTRVDPKKIEQMIGNILRLDPLEANMRYKSRIRKGPFKEYQIIDIGRKDRLIFRWIDGVLHFRTGTHETIAPFARKSKEKYFRHRPH